MYYNHPNFLLFPFSFPLSVVGLVLRSVFFDIWVSFLRHVTWRRRVLSVARFFCFATHGKRVCVVRHWESVCDEPAPFISSCLPSPFTFGGGFTRGRKGLRRR